MRHGKKFNHLGRTASHRKAMLANMASSLIEHKRINTTVAKAKALKNYVEPLITKSKSDTTHNRRIVFSYLRNKNAVSELFREVVAKVGDRPGGYTRIIKTGNRLGDNAEMCMIELVDFNELYTNEKAGKKKTTRRSRRGGGGKSEEKATATQAKAPAKEGVKETAEETKAEKAKTEETATEEAVKAEAQKADESKAEAKEDATGDDAKKDSKE